MNLPEPSYPRMWGLHLPGALLRGVLWSAVGFVAAHVFFPGEAPVVAVTLMALGQADYVEALLDRNRAEIYGGQMPARRANLRMARELCGLFLGIFAAYVAAVFLVPSERMGPVFGSLLGEFGGVRLREVDFGEFGVLMQRNLAVLLAGFLVSTLYRHGGILLILAWNAARWGVVLGAVGRLELSAGGAGAALPVLLVLPHLLFEALAYVLAAMAGAFLGRGALRHKLTSPVFQQVGVAVLVLLLLSGLALIVASAFESNLAGLLQGGGAGR